MNQRALSPAMSALLVFIGCAAVYARTAAPSVMGGDSAEFQMAAPLLGVAHPTTYPLYTLLGKVFTLILPFGDLAQRVTLVSAFAAALVAASMLLLARRVTGSTVAGLLAALALACSPGLWNSATMAEVYALLAALIMGLWLALAYVQPIALRQEAGLKHGLTPVPYSLFPVPRYRAPLLIAALLAGLGVSHHGMFAFTALPLFVVAALRATLANPAVPLAKRFPALIARGALLGLFAVVGLVPWLYPLIQYARFGPFSGEDYGLPRHYFWGAPSNWADAIGMLTGGPIRQGAFRLPTLETAGAVVQLVSTRLWFEFGPLGVALGLIGCAALLRRDRRTWSGAVWIFAGTLLYLLLLGPAVQDAPVFTLPMLLPWALWIGVGGQAVANAGWGVAARWRDTMVAVPITNMLLAGAIALTLAWGYTRLPYANKRHLTVWRDFGTTTLAQLPPNAVVIAHWEQGMVLQYLVQAEGQRPDVWVDVVEPGDDAWGPRALRRYADRPVFFVGSAGDVANLPVARVRHDAYADLYELNVKPTK